MRALLVLVAALLVPVSAVGAAGGLAGAAPEPATAPEPAALDSPAVTQTDGNASLEQINVLDVPPGAVEHSAVERHYVDLGPGVSLSTNATTDRLQTLSMVERVESAETNEERRARLRAELRRLETEVEGLESRQTDAIRAYNRGDINSHELLVSLVRISVAAEEYATQRSRIEQLATETSGYDINRGRLAAIGNRLSAFTGPVRTHAASVVRGETDPHRFYLSTGPESVTMSTIVDDTYLRESYRGDLRNGDGEAIELEVALDIVSASYPVIWNTTREQTQVFGGGNTYPVRIGHGRGDLTAFVDSDTRAVYAEHQRRPLDTVVADDRIEESGDDLHLAVNHTYPGGPVRVAVADESGDPVDVDVSITAGPGDATPLGRTGNDGVLWTLSPNRQYTITVDRGDDPVELVVAPGDPPLVERWEPGAGEADGGGNETNGTTTPTPTPTPAG